MRRLFSAALVAAVLAAPFSSFAARQDAGGKSLLPPASAKTFAIPAAAGRYRSLLLRSARLVWGLAAPTATFAAQVQTESWWNPADVSCVGARGLAQFMPGTAHWLAKVRPAVGAPNPHSPAWALRALPEYNKILWDLYPDAANQCERAAFMLSAYNGGQGSLSRDRKKAAAQGVDASRWFGAVETVNAGRRLSAYRENRAYPRRVLVDFEPAYIAAGWGAGLCH